MLYESSGGYERLFLSVARRMGLRTALVSPERVHGLKKVESVDLGRARVARMVRSRVPGVKGATLDAPMGAAALSVRSAPPAPVAAVLSERLSVLLSELEMHERQAERLKAQIEALGERLKAEEELPAIDEAVEGITRFNLARVVGQTGPLDDFASKRQLLRYAGMNLRERESGTYGGPLTVLGRRA